MAINAKYKQIVEEHSLAAAAAGVPGALLPGLDILSLTGIWTGIVIKISGKSGHDYRSEVLIKEFITSVLTGISLYVASSGAFIWLLNFIPGVGTLAAIGINAFINTLFTYRFGVYCANTFDRDTFDFEDMSALTQHVRASLLLFPTFSERGAIIDMMKS